MVLLRRRIRVSSVPFRMSIIITVTLGHYVPMFLTSPDFPSNVPTCHHQGPVLVKSGF